MHKETFQADIDIRYCLPLDSRRPFQTPEHEFFKFIRERDIPLVFVLTMLDKLHADKILEIAENWRRPTLEEEGKAQFEAEKYVRDLKVQLEREAGRGIAIQEVSKQPEGEVNFNTVSLSLSWQV